MQSTVDVLVIGGGPSGTTAASFLAEQGRSVLLLEKDEHPRFHIGESLLPSNLPILERLGVLAQVEAIGVYKPGADFTVADSQVQPFPFARALGDTPDHAWQVKRSEFDQILFENCKRFGVDARQKHQVTEVTPVAGGHQVRFRNAAGEYGEVAARFVIDASGRDGFFARKQGWRKKNPGHASAAVFGHFTNVVRREGALEGNISVYWFEQGWVWMIPLRDGVMSIGAVCWPEYLRTRDVDLETFLRNTLAQIPDAQARVKDAVAISPINATGNYSYRSEKIWGEGFLLVGDAYAFIDPVFSSGVYLAMNSGQRCTPAVDAWLNGEHEAYAHECRNYHKMVERKIYSFSWFIYRFTTPTMRELFRGPRNDWQVEQAVIAMLVGDGDGSPLIRSRLRIFKTLYMLFRLKRLPESTRAWWKRWRNARIQFTDETILS